jgi:hypothetical protein
MQDLQGLFGDTLLPSYHCRVRSGIFMPDIDPAEANQVVVPCHNPSGTNFVSCQDRRIQAFLREVDGLSFNVAPSSTVQVFDPYIPIFDYRTIPLAHKAKSDVVGLTLLDILMNPLRLVAGKYTVPKIAFREAAVIRRLCEEKKVILFLSGLDVLIETIWHQRSVCEFFQQLNMMGFWSVTGFNFSVFGGECPVAHHLNQKKSLASSMLLEEIGLSTIPHIYAVNDFHIKRYQAWLQRNPQIKLVIMNCQMQHKPIDIDQVVRSVQGMLIMNDELHIILQGYWFSKLDRFNGFLDRIHIAESKPVKYGQSFQSVDKKIITRPGQYAKDAYKSIVLENVEYRIAEMAQILSRG